MTRNIALIRGDGIGPEIVEQAKLVLDKVAAIYGHEFSYTAETDCMGLIQAANCGVRLIATAHGFGLQDLRQRQLYQPLLEKRIFHSIVLLSRDKSYRVERMVS